MRMLVLGFVHRSGVAKATKRPFDFAQLIGTHEIETVANENYQQRGEGFDRLEVPLTLEALNQFKGLKFPGVYELKMDHRPGNRGEIEVVCVGVTRAAAAAAA